jgi:tRNA pseudouridine38-40 synthase
VTGVQTCALPISVRIIHKIEILKRGLETDLVFEGNRFLMHQVRIMTGTLVDIGRGRIDEGGLPAILQARDRARAGRTAPPHGLCLEEVWYQSRWGVGEPCPWGEAQPEP